jgi:hypothetical protein
LVKPYDHMLVSLPNGTTVDIPFDIDFDINSSDFRDLNAVSSGDRIEDPFFGSMLQRMNDQVLDEEFEEEVTDLSDEIPDTNIIDED